MISETQIVAQIINSQTGIDRRITRDTRVETRYHDTSRPQSESNRFGGKGGGYNRSDRGESGDDRSQNTANPHDTERRTIRISSLRMTPVDLPHVPILLNETFITAMWDTGAEKSFISKEVYRRYFSYRPRQRTKDRVVTAQGAPCCHLGRVELQIRNRDF
ncbi:uncharacterized protein TNCV_1669761 [Trichonephila clavipes]|nr:uncharacterized protein TNCV_1669761 [Trichonephila clavipes]